MIIDAHDDDLVFLEESRVALVDYLGSDARVVEAARVSTKGEGSRGQEADEGLIRYLLREGHWSPFEHASATFLIETPLFTRSQLVRHKSFSFNEESARYRQMRPRFYIPPHSRPVKAQGKPGHYVMVHDEDAVLAARAGLRLSAYAGWSNYQRLIEAGVTRELARAVLPQHLVTSLYMTGTLRSWIHFLQSRDDETAQFEVRAVAQKVRRELEAVFPVALKETR